MLLELYLDLTINTLVNFYHLKFAFGRNSMVGDKLSAMFALCTALIIFTAPIILTCFINKHKFDT